MKIGDLVANGKTIATVKVGDTITNYSDLHEALEAGKAAGSVVTLVSDVALSGTWTQIADFAGTFDGDGFTVSGLTVNGAGNLGLFAKTTGATIKDLTITGAKINGTGNDLGVLAGSISNTTVTNVSITNSTVTSTEGEYVGSFAGHVYGNISGCTATGNTITGVEQVGGIGGYLWCGSIKDSTANNTVIATVDRAGGIVGKANTDNYYKIDGNTASGTVSVPSGKSSGGIAGQIMGGGTGYEIKDNTISVTGTTNPIGSLRGDNDAAFNGALAANITGNWWEDATLAADSFNYEPTNADVQTIYRGVATVVSGSITRAYKSLADAIEAAGAPDVVMLLQDITLTSTQSIAKTVTIDLNGKTITPAASGLAASAKGTTDALFAVNYGGSLTVKDTSANETGKIGTNGATDVYAAVKLTEKGETRTGEEVAAFTLESGSLVGDYYAIVGNGSRPGTAIAINGGTVSGTHAGDNQGIFNPQGDSTVTVTGGTITGYSSAIEMRGGSLTVNGGTLESTATTYSVAASGSGSTTVGAAIAVAQHTTKQDVSVSITGGTISGAAKAVSVANPQKNDSTNVTVTLGEATYTGELAYSADGNATVSNEDSGLTAPEGYYWKGSAAPYTLAKIVAKIGDVNYDSLQAAVDAVENGETITITANNTEALTVSKAMTFYITGGTFNKPTGTGFTVDVSDTKVTVTEDGCYTVSLTSRIAGTGTTVASVGGGGSIGAGTGTTLYASSVAGYEFLGWYTDYVYDNTTLPATYNIGTLVSKEAVYAYKPTADVILYAVYKADDTAMVELTVNASEFTVNGVAQSVQYQDNLKAASTLDLAYTGSDKFLYWRNGSGAIVSTSSFLRTSIVGDTEYTAVTAATETTGSALVVFKNLEEGGQQIKANYYTNTSNISYPANPSSYGKNFVKWVVRANGKEYEATPDKIHELIAGGATYLVVYGGYESKATYKVTVKFVFSDGYEEVKDTLNVLSGDSCSYQVTDTPSAFPFSHYEINGNVVSTNEHYSFVPTADTTLVAKLGNFGVGPMNRVSIDKVTASADGGRYKISIKSSYTFDGGSAVKYGILFYTSPNAVFEYGNKDYIKYYEWDQSIAALATGTMILHVTTKDPTTTIYYRAYAIDNNNNIVYSPVESATVTYSGSASYNTAEKY